jgi:nanoRNase/pAp phosphatase (c-di-AMP/oligoRNAs hydrolase)
MSRLATSQATKSDELLQVLSEFDRFLVVMHDNPDPDAIATGWGLQVLIRRKLNRPVRVVGGGAIVRAENRHLVELLQPPIELVDDLEVSEGTTTILVDCGSEATNHLLTRKRLHPIGVIDHHVNEGLDEQPAFQDIRPHVAASATIAASYLREQRIDPGVKLATAMIYAQRTETCGSETHYSALDRSILPWLTERAEPALLAEIENAPLSREYFGDLLLAMQGTFVYDRVALCFLPRASGAEIVGEVADLLIRCEGIQQVLCGAIVGSDLVLSARTERDCGSATKLLSTTLEGLGGAGGHAHRAGGKITAVGRGVKIAEELYDELRRRWLKACGVTRRRGTRLIPKREIVENL